MSKETVNGMEQAGSSRSIPATANDSMPSAVATQFIPMKPENLVRPQGIKPPPLPRTSNSK